MRVVQALGIRSLVQPLRRQIRAGPTTLWRSDDAGASWKVTHDEPLDEVVYSYGYYFGLQLVLRQVRYKEIPASLG